MNPEDIIKQTNEYRAKSKLPPLAVDPQLTQAALARAKDMQATNTFSHTVATTTPKVTWATFIKNAGYDYDYAGENLATHFDDATSTMKGWQASPKHNENLVDKKYSNIGVAVVPVLYEGKQTHFIVQMFGTPKKKQPAVPLLTDKSVEQKKRPIPTAAPAKTMLARRPLVPLFTANNSSKPDFSRLQIKKKLNF